MKNKRIYPTEEDPRYGQRFIIKGIQFIDIEGDYTPMIDFVEVSFKGSKVFEVGSNWNAWKRNKAIISDAMYNGLNNNAQQSYERRRQESSFVREPRPNFRDAVSLKVEYLMEPDKTYII